MSNIGTLILNLVEMENKDAEKVELKAQYKEAKEVFKFGEEERELTYEQEGLTKRQIKQREYDAKAEIRHIKAKLSALKRKRKMQELKGNKYIQNIFKKSVIYNIYIYI